MSAIDSVSPSRPDSRNSMAPPYVNEDPNEAMVEQGLDLAEDEVREAVADAYEASALLSDDPSESLDDIDYASSEGGTISGEPSVGIDFASSEGAAISPEEAAIQEEFLPEKDHDISRGTPEENNR
jgi:hypothetical protein